ncbi:putative ibr finger domain-containing protein [Erysiphe neolycopersici]|uniref:RBR-type E3 ubiquitin transferase n=1 Tax=Erysiphe neolycopersici TaxID=212602 RepID=A0A420H903_9PEZI|nr:putative ibr finger domain-containing protein [Erysiphe neolycopersici]
MDFDDTMDDATAALIYQLQLQDTTELFHAQNENRELSDSRIALESYRRELEINYSIISDRIMTRSIAQACRTDGPEVFNLLHGERTIELDEGVEYDSDSQSDFEINEAESHSIVQRQSIETQEIIEESLQKHGFSLDESLEMNDILDKTEAPPLENLDLRDRQEIIDDSSGRTSPEFDFLRRTTRGKFVEIVTENCVSCQEIFPLQELIQCPCDHTYCSECLSKLIQTSIKDDELFPPKCCKQPIPLANVMFLSPELIHSFEAKKIEFETKDRTYCSNQTCSAFIQPINIEGDNAICPECETVTCKICKAASHDGDCPADTALQSTIQLAKANGWKRCFNCRCMIELDTGCNHMTCPCGTQFCYVCSERWKTCECPQWDEGLLLARPEDMNHDLLPQMVIDLEHEVFDEVADATEVVRLQESCFHGDWRWLRGRHRCQECFHQLPTYIFECGLCSYRACNRCRRNIT